MPTDVDVWLGELRQRFAELSPAQARADHQRGALLIDVRESEELQGGLPEGALHIPRSFLELRIGKHVSDSQQPLRLLCEAGSRSLVACSHLAALGYSDVASVAGGVQAWKAEGLPISEPATLDTYQQRRYLRHIQLPEIGLEGQTRLSSARVLVVGAGGLGCPAAQYLAAAGVGQIDLVDDDRVELSNLQRQILHAEARIGMHKAESAALALRALNPSVLVNARVVRLDDSNVDELIADCDLVLDGSDNFRTRYLINSACLRHSKALIYGAVQGFTGQVSVFWPSREGGPWPCYRCLFPDPPPAQFAPNCSEAGVLGVVPGLVGVMQAAEAIKLLLGIGEPLTGSLLQIELLGGQFRRLRLSADPHCPGCGDALSRRDVAHDSPGCSIYP